MDTKFCTDVAEMATNYKWLVKRGVYFKVVAFTYLAQRVKKIQTRSAKNEID